MVLAQGSTETTLTQGVARAADRAGVRSDSTDSELKVVAQDYAKAKARYLGRNRKVTRAWIADTVSSESRGAYRQLIAYRSELADEDNRNHRINRGAKLRNRYSVKRHRAAEYADIRTREHTAYRRVRNWSVACLVLCLSLVGLLGWSYLLGSEETSGGNRNATVTVYSRSNDITSVSMGRLDRLSDDDAPSMSKVDVADKSQFDIDVEGLERSETLHVTVEGEGLVGCKVTFDGGIVATTKASAREATCKTSG